MGSVEELCDEITLINRSHNILSGSVRDLREQFSDNRYAIAYVGSPDALRAAVEPVCTSFVPGAIDTDGNATVTVSLRAAEALKPFIAAANDAVTINSFRRMLPSMDDIFVSAVEASNTSAL